MTEQENACVWQLALRVCAMRLSSTAVNNNNGTGATPTAALSAIAALTYHAETLDRLLASAGKLFIL